MWSMGVWHVVRKWAACNWWVRVWQAAGRWLINIRYIVAEGRQMVGMWLEWRPQVGVRLLVNDHTAVIAFDAKMRDYSLDY